VCHPSRRLPFLSSCQQSRAQQQMNDAAMPPPSAHGVGLVIQPVLFLLAASLLLLFCMLRHNLACGFFRRLWRFAWRRRKRCRQRSAAVTKAPQVSQLRHPAALLTR